MNTKTYILNLETTTKNCSVSLACNGNLIALKELNSDKYSHAEYLNLFIDEVLQQGGISFEDLSAVAVSQGPGSYTGLRIGVSTAKGLCYALNIPLIAIDTLEVLARQLSVDDGIIIPVLDARRMEVYQAVFNTEYEVMESVKPMVLTPDAYDTYFNKTKVYFVGNATLKMQTIIKHDKAVFQPESSPSAQEMGSVSFEKFKQSHFEDTAYFEPFYLKDFIALKSMKK